MGEKRRVVRSIANTLPPYKYQLDATGNTIVPGDNLIVPRRGKPRIEKVCRNCGVRFLTNVAAARYCRVCTPYMAILK